MKQSILALPALLRGAVYFASASQRSFSVNDDVFAFPQYEVKFSDDYVTDLEVKSRYMKAGNAASLRTAPSDEIGTYQPLEGEELDEDKAQYLEMTLEGQKYLCAIPDVPQPDARRQQTTGANETTQQAERELELSRAADRGWELLRGMQGNCVYFLSGWWSYKFCYNDGVRQFHQLPPNRGLPAYPPIEDPGVEGFTLGMYQNKQSDEVREDSNAKTTELVQRGDTRYLVQKLEGGTRCDLTGKDRRIEVQFHCNPQSADRISLIKEVSTCAYLMVIQTPRLCNDVAFQPPQKDQPNAIACKPVLAENEVADYEKEVRALRNAEKEARIWEASPEAAQIFLGEGRTVGRLVGDILVGSNSIVPESVKLEKSAIVGGGKEKFIDTVASSNGKVLSKEALEKLGLGDSRSVEQLRRDLEKIADGREWKLNVVETANRREYRGIIGDEDDEDDTKEPKETKETKKEKSQQTEKTNEGSEEEYYKEEL